MALGFHRSEGVGVVTSVTQRNFEDDTIHSIRVRMEGERNDGSGYEAFHTVETRNARRVPDVGDLVYWNGTPSVRVYQAKDGSYKAAFTTRGIVNVIASMGAEAAGREE
jgi:hypothetical protein